MIFSNVDEEIEKLKMVKELVNEINSIECKKMFVSREQLAEVFGCSVRAAGEFMNENGFPLIKIGGKSFVNIFALNEFTQQRIVLAEERK